MGQLRNRYAQLVVEGGREGKGETEDDPSGPLVPGLQEPFKQAALGHPCAGTMTGERGQRLDRVTHTWVLGAL